MSQTYLQSIAISIANLQISYISWFHQFKPLQLRSTIPCPHRIDLSSFLLYSIGKKEFLLWQLLSENHYFVEQTTTYHHNLHLIPTLTSIQQHISVILYLEWHLNLVLGEHVIKKLSIFWKMNNLKKKLFSTKDLIQSKI